MGIKRIGHNLYSYDLHVWGVKARPRGTFEGTRRELIKFLSDKSARLQKSGSLTLRTVNDILQTYLTEHYHKTARYAVSGAPFEAVVKGIGHYSLDKFTSVDFMGWRDRKAA
jgi:hypothetical protein